MAITIPISVAGPYLPYLGFITVFHNPFRSPSTFSQHLRGPGSSPGGETHTLLKGLG